MRSIVLIVLITFGQIASSQLVQIDSLTKLIKENKCKDSLLVDSLFIKARALSIQENYNKGLFMVHRNYGGHLQCMNKFQQADSIYRIAIAHGNKGIDIPLLASVYRNNIDVLTNMGRYREAIAFGKQGIELLGNAPHTKLRVALHSALTVPYIKLGELDIATEHALEALRSAQESNDSHLMAKPYSTVGLIYYKREMLAEAIAYTEQAAERYQQSKDSVAYANHLYRIGAFYSTKKEYQMAETNTLKAISIFENLNNTYFLVYCYSGLGHMYYEQDKPSLSIKYNQKAYELARKAGMKDMEGVTLGNIGSTYLKTGQPTKATTFLKRAIQLLESLESNDLLLDCYKEYSRALSMVGKDNEALVFYKKYHDLDKKVLDLEKENKISELQTKYDTERLTAEKETAQAKTALAENKAKQNSYYLITVIGIAILMAVTAIIFMARQKAKKKMELIAVELKEVQKRLALEKQYRESELKALKSQMNPHFIFNALNSIQEFIITNKKEEASNYLGQFAQLIRTYLEHSDTGLISLSEEVASLTMYLDLEVMRFENAFEYSIDIANLISQDTIFIPTMLIQPYVENAIKHGLLHRRGKKTLSIIFKKSDEETLQCIIEDNGIGRAKTQELQKIRNIWHKPFATKATQERLNLLNYGKDKKIGVEIKDLTKANKAMGTRVILTIPIKKR